MYAIPIERAAARSEPVSSIRWSRRQGPSPKKRRLSLSHRKTRMSDFMKRSPSFGFISGMVRRDHEENPEVSYEQDHEPVLWKIQPGSRGYSYKTGRRTSRFLRILMDQEAEPDAPPVDLRKACSMTETGSVFGCSVWISVPSFRSSRISQYASASVGSWRQRIAVFCENFSG